MQERAAIAAAIRGIADNPLYTIEQIADELEAMNERRPAWA